MFEYTRKPFVILSLACLVLVLSTTAMGEYRTMTDFMLRVNRDWVTPHQSWGKPYANGTPHVLYICPKLAAPREIVELSERMNLSFDVVITDRGDHLGVPEFKKDVFTAHTRAMLIEGRIKELDQKLDQSWDVIVLGHMRYSAIPPKLREKLKKKVRRGTGLVLVYDGGFPESFEKQLVETTGAKEILTGIPIEQNPGYIACQTFRPKDQKAKPIVRLYTLGKGRVAVIDYGHFYSPPVGQNGPAYGLTPWVVHWPMRGWDSTKIKAGGVLSSLSESGNEKMIKRYPLYSWSTPVDYEHALMLPARTILWASRKMQPTVSFVKAPKTVKFDQTKKDNSITYQVISQRPMSVDLHYTFRSAIGDVLAEGTLKGQALSNKPTDVVIEAPKTLPVCKAFCEVKVVSDRGAEAWAATPVTITGPATMTIESRAKSKVEIGQTIKVPMCFSPAAVGKKVILSGWDTHRREVLRTRPLEITGQKMSVDVVVPNVDTLLVLLQGQLVDSRGTVLALSSQSKVVINQQTVRRDNFPVVMWDREIGGYLEQLSSLQVRKLGANVEISYPAFQNDEDALYRNTMILPMISSLEEFKYGTGDLELIKRQMEYYRQGGKFLRRYPMLAYNFGDEINMGHGGFDLGTDKHWHKRFVAFLKKKYQTIGSLNKAWGSNLEAFSAIVPMKLQQARKDKFPALIIERWAFLQREWAQFFADAFDAIRKEDPQAYVGWEGMGSDDPRLWASWRRLGPLVDMWGRYQHNECDLVTGTLFRSFVPRRVLRGYWWGGYLSMRKPSALRYLLWNHVVQGANAMFIYQTFGGEGIFGVDFTPSYHLRLQMGDLKKVITEIGPLAGKSRWSPDPIALYWSLPSQIAREILGGRNIRWDVQHSLLHLIHHSGYVPSFVDGKSALDPKKYKAIVLYDAQCLSDLEVEKLTAYVRQGGTLIADVPPATATELGRPRSQPALDHLFGITRNQAKTPPELVALSPAKVALRTRFNGVKVQLVRPDGQPVEVAVSQELSLKGAARAYGKTDNNVPVMIVNKTGAGRTILLNMTLDGFFNPVAERDHYSPFGAECEVLRKVVYPEAMPRFFEQLMASLGITAQAKTLSNGRRVSNIRTSIYRNGADQLLALACLPIQQEGNAIAQLSKPYHVVDLKTRKYLGQMDQIPFKLGPGVGHAYSLLRQRPSKPTVRLSARTLRPGDALSLTITPAKRGQRVNVLKVVTTGPDGKVLPWLSKTFASSGPSAVFSAGLAWNDPAGIYQIRVLDVASGMEASVSFELTK